MVTRLLAVHYEVTTGYSCNRHYSQMKDKVMSRFYRLQWLRSYLLYIVRLQQVTEVTGIIQTKVDKVMYNFCKLQGLRGYLLCIVRLQQVIEVTGIIHSQKKVMSRF